MPRSAEQFDVADVARGIVEKLIRRHPHVFGDVSVTGTDEVLANWEQIKRGEKGYEDRVSILDGIPAGLPALMRALEVSKRVVKVGFEWPGVDEVLDKVEEETRRTARRDRRRRHRPAPPMSWATCCSPSSTSPASSKWTRRTPSGA